jgi:hypothetical protein
MVRPALEELAASRILLRVSSTVLHGLGQRLDIPFAIDVAKQSTRAFEGVVHQAIGLIALREDAHCSELAALDQLGQIADRLSDLLCGALLPAFKCDDYLVDRARGHDFADTFGRDPSLVRVPMQQALKRFPRQVEAVATAIEVKQSLAACLPMLNSEPKAAGGQCVNQSGQKIGLSSTELRIVGGHTQDSLRDEAVVFPTHSFARSRRRLSPDRE